MGRADMRVFVTGASGQLGTALAQRFAGCDLVTPSHRDLDLQDGLRLREAATAARPDVILNCAAFNLVDAAEQRPQEALALNACAVRALARAAEDTGATLVHYGSDFVLDGTASSPYDETAEPAPRSTYGASKLLGEWLALDAPKSYVLRVQSLFGSSRSFGGRRGSMDGILEGLEAGREVTVLTDRVITPGYVVDIAAATRHLIDTGAPFGLYHCANDGPTRWSDIAEELASLLGITPNLRRVTTQELGLPASRPVYSAFSVARLASTGFMMPQWRDALRRWLSVR
jgi:dTDP-4-dehydrorhamnose reductase